MWSVSRALQIPLDSSIENLSELPYTISYAIRKRSQLDNLYELPKDKRPPDSMIWDGTSDDLESWLDRVLYKNEPTNSEFVIFDSEIEG